MSTYEYEGYGQHEFEEESGYQGEYEGEFAPSQEAPFGETPYGETPYGEYGGYQGEFEEEFARYTTPREWWRVATDESGEPVGFVIPARNSYHHIIAYIGVLPEHRGRGLIDGILTEGTRVLAEAGAPYIRASTDVGNVPMVAAFARGGYATFERIINLAWDAPAG